MVLTYINFSLLQSYIGCTGIPDNIIELPLIQSVVACKAFLMPALAFIKWLIYGVPTIIVGCVININNELLLIVYDLYLILTIPLNLLINIIQQDYYLAIFMTIIIQSDFLLVLGMDNVPIGHPSYIPVPGFFRPNSLGPPKPYPAPGIQEPKGGVNPKPPTTKPRFGDPGL
uniref:hypothetical protein n=1 Tax=Diaporthe sojae TaxID=165439 RepID=UPI00240EF256|nr:hypothetical protein QAZ32_mgp01 [Diaporthe sojae]WET30438.1 hypothetical protein [Diaporthe sojae]